ncbi:hypothetical protein CTA2_4990 [Colletotrichum tanaceti]|uniref:Ubiquitin-like protease family profile domain-containing protein n=1 Tax=Colletotrichum tanaceti TaxID=1306861 RepID=A0A4U6X5N3_9PEZI|nr:hypothetical protein CTA2_4990 [Colletotrichum tanaceti]TKW50364.1 hypothetical protein CTA1_2649 [Colletotrichum tanaceti]
MSSRPLVSTPPPPSLQSLDPLPACPPAPARDHSRAPVNADPVSRLPDALDSRAFYSDFMAGLAMIPPETNVPELAVDLNNLLDDYQPNTASHVRTDFVIDSYKIRKATTLLRRDLSEEETIRLQTNINIRRRKMVPAQLQRSQNMLRHLVGGPALGDGTPVTSITSIGNCQLLIRIINHVVEGGDDDAINRLWQTPDGILCGVGLTKRGLEAVWNRVRHAANDRQINNDSLAQESTEVPKNDAPWKNNTPTNDAPEMDEALENTATQNDEPVHNEDNMYGGDISGSEDGWNPAVDAYDGPSVLSIAPNGNRPRPREDDAASDALSPELSRKMAVSPVSRVLSSPPSFLDMSTVDVSCSERHNHLSASTKPLLGSNTGVEHRANSSPLFSSRSEQRQAVTTSANTSAARQEPPRQDPPRQDQDPPRPLDTSSAAASKTPATAQTTKSLDDTLRLAESPVRVSDLDPDLDPVPSASGKRLGTTIELQPFRKKRTYDSPRPNRLEAELATIDTRPLTSQECLNASIVNGAINLVVSLCPLSLQLLDSACTDGQASSLSPAILARLPTHPDGLVVAPLHLPDAHHWVLAIPMAAKVYMVDSCAIKGPELEAKAHHLHRLLRSSETPDTAGNDNANQVAVEDLGCHKQDNSVDCGVAVIVNVCRLVAGQDRFDAQTDYALWRRVIAALIDPAKHNEIVDKKAFAPLAEIKVSGGQPLNALPNAQNNPMSLMECSQWYEAQAARLEAFRMSVAQQARPLMAKCRASLAALRDVEGVLSGMHNAGGRNWHLGGGSMTSGLRRRSDLFSDEVSEAVASYRSIIGEINRLPFRDPDSLASLNKKMAWLLRLQESRWTSRDRIVRVLELVRQGRTWLEKLERSGAVMMPCE